jgi:hypothetical protein
MSPGIQFEDPLRREDRRRNAATLWRLPQTAIEHQRRRRVRESS